MLGCHVAAAQTEYLGDGEVTPPSSEIGSWLWALLVALFKAVLLCEGGGLLCPQGTSSKDCRHF